MLVISEPLLKFEIVFGADFGSSGVGRAQGGIELQCLLHRSLRLWNGVFRSSRAVVPEKEIRVGQAHVGERIAGIACDRLIEKLNRFVKIRAGSFVPKEPAFQVKLMSFAIRS